MSKVRISISLAPEHAERVRAHAERAGMDVSSYMVNAATRQMAEAEAADEVFSGIDALIAKAETRATGYTPADDATELSEGERREVADAMRLVYGDEAEQNPGQVA
ncbi:MULTISPECIES: hypothetical protein [Nocardiopsis]|uniref:Ribbon-helix-helix protein CopG domain-containing protein n=1 Tax=Nocardiopsis sinuspersici TaxID=501010 RepID=A0A1V3C7Q5_9ACTN|nr:MULTISPECIES: hypothetical protein [Nocardiopsis]OOC56781.1 hypothetical protein NOSIN_25535 [Nocardiopsis sinuspersici]